MSALGKKRKNEIKETPKESSNEENDNDEIEYEEMSFVEPSFEEIQKSQMQLKDVINKIKELQEEEKKIDDFLKGTRAKELFDYFKIPRDQFVFKVVYENGEFYEKAAKNYIIAILKRICFSQTKEELKILEYKNLSNYLWFKLDKKIRLPWLVKKSKGNENFHKHTITQMRNDHFFEDI